MGTTNPGTSRQPGGSRLATALALHCPPLLAAANLLARGLYGESAQLAWFVAIRWPVVLAACCWGLGYLPLRRWGRAAISFAAGLVANLLAANAALGAWSVAPDGAGDAALDRSALAWGCAIVVAVLTLLGDTWRLACDATPGTPTPTQHIGSPTTNEPNWR